MTSTAGRLAASSTTSPRVVSADAGGVVDFDGCLAPRRRRERRFRGLTGVDGDKCLAGRPAVHAQPHPGVARFSRGVPDDRNNPVARRARPDDGEVRRRRTDVGDLELDSGTGRRSPASQPLS